MRADPALVYDLAAAVERWPVILPHYRRVRVLHEDAGRRVVAMAAWRDGIPVAWTAVQECFPEERRITFRHIRGVTTGMDVAWRLDPSPDGVQVSIWHRFEPRWPLVPDTLVRRVIGEFFVDNIAGKTLRRVREIAEAAGQTPA
jgi:ribosome-associated toxin RatA of RatAB toxin-antitoxin module